MGAVDEALFRSLRVRFELGLFDGGPTAPGTSRYWQYGPEMVGTAEAAALNLRAAEEGMVLLRNPAWKQRAGAGAGAGRGGGGAGGSSRAAAAARRVLPLAPGTRIALLGPHVDGALADAIASANRLPGEGRASGGVGGGMTLVERGCTAFTRCDQMEEALSAARASEAVVLAVGGVSCVCTGKECEADKPEGAADGAGGTGQGGGGNRGSGYSKRHPPSAEPEECQAARVLDRQCFGSAVNDLPSLQQRCAQQQQELQRNPTTAAAAPASASALATAVASSRAGAEAAPPCSAWHKGLMKALQKKCRAEYPQGGVLSPSAHVEGERHDRRSIDLPQAQRALAAAVLRLGKPVVIVLTGHGGSVALEQELSAPNAAIIDAFQPGGRGAEAIASSIFGRANRWGKMPYTMLRANWTATNPIEEHEVSAARRTYRYMDGAAASDSLVPFGFGLSLSRWELSLVVRPHGRRHQQRSSDGGGAVSGAAAVALASEHMAGARSPAVVQLRTDGSDGLDLIVRLTNLGPLVGDQVLQLYMHPRELLGSADARAGGSEGGATREVGVRPLKALIDFARARDVACGTNRAVEVTFGLDATKLQLVGRNGDRLAAPGRYLLSVETGDPSVDGAGGQGGGGGVAAASVEVHLVGRTHVFERFPTV